MKNTVVTIFKNNDAIAVTPADINILINYININKITQRQFFTEVCLPGMTEEYRLPVYIKSFMNSQNEGSDLKIIYVCEEKNDQISQKLTDLTDNIFKDLIAENLI
jgi:hydrogenase maturation factor